MCSVAEHREQMRNEEGSFASTLQVMQRESRLRTTVSVPRRLTGRGAMTGRRLIAFRQYSQIAVRRPED